MRSHPRPPLQGALCFLSSQELQCLLGYVITQHSAALGPRSCAGAAGSELLSSSSAAAAAAASASSSGSASSASSSDGDNESGGAGEEQGSCTPDLASPSHGGRGFAAAPLDPLQDASLASYDPGCASVFGFGVEGDSSGGGGGAGGALLQHHLAAAAQQPGSLLADLPAGRELWWVLRGGVWMPARLVLGSQWRLHGPQRRCHRPALFPGVAQAAASLAG